MYKCNECGGLFSDPVAVYLTPSQQIEQGYIEKNYCPFCGHDEINQVHECGGCSNYVESLDYGLCDKCRTSIPKQFHQMLTDKFTKAEIEYLDVISDGNYLSEVGK